MIPDLPLPLPLTAAVPLVGAEVEANTKGDGGTAMDFTDFVARSSSKE